MTPCPCSVTIVLMWLVMALNEFNNTGLVSCTFLYWSLSDHCTAQGHVISTHHICTCKIILCSGQLQRSHGDMMGRTLLGDRIKVERNKGWIGLQRGDRSWGRVWGVSRIHGTQSPSLGLCSAGTVQTVPLCAVQNLTTKGRQGGSHPLWTLDTVWQESGAMSSCF